MKHTYRLLFAAILCATNYTAVADNTFEKTHFHNEDVAAEPRLQLSFFPGIAHANHKSLVMHMVDTSNQGSSIFNLNSSLVGPVNSIDTKKYFDDIKITNNNIFELKF